MLKFMSWSQGVFTFLPGIAELVAYVHPIFKAHLVLGLTILLVFPFTRLVHMLSAPVWYLNRRGWQLVRTKRAMPLRREAVAPIYPIVALTTAQETSVQAVQPKTLKAAE